MDNQNFSIKIVPKINSSNYRFQTNTMNSQELVTAVQRHGTTGKFLAKKMSKFKITKKRWWTLAHKNWQNRGFTYSKARLTSKIVFFSW